MSIQETIKALQESEASKGPREPYLNVAGKDTRGVLTVLQFTEKQTLNSGSALFPIFKFDEVRPQKEGVVLPAVGSRAANPFMINSKKSQWTMKYARADAKSFILTVLGFKEADVSPEELGEAMTGILSKEQPFRGMKVGYETYTKANSNLVLVAFSHVAGQSAEAIAANRKSLEKDFPTV